MNNPLKSNAMSVTEKYEVIRLLDQNTKQSEISGELACSQQASSPPRSIMSNEYFAPSCCTNHPSNAFSPNALPLRNPSTPLESNGLAAILLYSWSPVDIESSGDCRVAGIGRHGSNFKSCNFVVSDKIRGFSQDGRIVEDLSGQSYRLVGPITFSTYRVVNSTDVPNDHPSLPADLQEAFRRGFPPRPDWRRLIVGIVTFANTIQSPVSLPAAATATIQQQPSQPSALRSVHFTDQTTTTTTRMPQLRESTKESIPFPTHQLPPYPNHPSAPPPPEHPTRRPMSKRQNSSNELAFSPTRMPPNHTPSPSDQALRTTRRQESPDGFVFPTPRLPAYSTPNRHKPNTPCQQQQQRQQPPPSNSPALSSVVLSRIDDYNDEEVDSTEPFDSISAIIARNNAKDQRSPVSSSASSPLLPSPPVKSKSPRYTSKVKSHNKKTQNKNVVVASSHHHRRLHSSSSSQSDSESASLDSSSSESDQPSPPLARTVSNPSKRKQPQPVVVKKPVGNRQPRSPIASSSKRQRVREQRRSRSSSDSDYSVHLSRSFQQNSSSSESDQPSPPLARTVSNPSKRKQPQPVVVKKPVGNRQPRSPIASSSKRQRVREQRRSRSSSDSDYSVHLSRSFQQKHQPKHHRPKQSTRSVVEVARAGTSSKHADRPKDNSKKAKPPHASLSLYSDMLPSQFYDNERQIDDEFLLYTKSGIFIDTRTLSRTRSGRLSIPSRDSRSFIQSLEMGEDGLLRVHRQSLFD